MDLLVLGILLSITFSTVQGAMPSCCVTTAKRFPRKLLRKVKKYDVQTNEGICEIKALVLYVEDKKYCLDPKQEGLVRKIIQKKIKKARKNSPAV